MYRKVQFFFSVLYFFINLVYNESLYYCNSCMLEQISYLGKFWILIYGPKCSWPIRLRDFWINCRNLKLTVSHKKINEIDWFFVCLSNSFLRDWIRKKKIKLPFLRLFDNFLSKYLIFKRISYVQSLF